jgi:hypothetical protein
VFSGPVLTLLNADELKSLLGHELAHFHLWWRDQGEFQIADRLLDTVAHDPRASLSHIQSARRYQLYTEIFADRGALWVTNDLHPVISSLVKIQTGLSQVSAASYLKQADEIFAQSKVITEQLSHPEAFIRTRALALNQEDRDNVASEISAMIEGTTTLEDLDLLGQVQLTQATRHLLVSLLQPPWFQTPAVLGHARLFFDDFQPAARKNAPPFKGLKLADHHWREYGCYVLLDFVAIDPELDEMPLAAAFNLCRQLGWEILFEKIVTKELKIKARDLKRIKEQAAEMLAKAEVKGE